MPLSSTQRINLGFPAALLLVALTGIIAFASTVRLAAVSTQVKNSQEVLTYTESVLTELGDAESAQRGFVITGDLMYLSPLRNAGARIETDLDKLDSALVGMPMAQRERADQLRPLAERRARLIRDVVATRSAFGFDSAAAVVASGRGRELMDSVRTIASAIQSAETARLAIATRRAANVTRLAKLTVAVGSLLAFLMVLAGVLSVRHEFSVRRRAETALRENETLLKQFMDTLPIGAFVVDADGKANFANTMALAMLGRDALGAELGEDALRLWHAGASDPVPHEENPMTKALRGLAARAEDLEIRMAGRPLPVEISAAPVFDSEGRVAYGIAAFADVTERKRNQAALRAAKDAAEQANQAKSEFLARMSHELRTPLNSIIGFANILIKKNAAALPEKERTYLERILDNGKHLLLLINDILDLSKIEAGKVVVEKEMVELGPLVAEVLHQWDGQLRPGVVVQAVVPPETTPIFTDRARLRQILINLVSNAVKFTEQGSVRVIVENGEGLPRPHCIKVVDTGIGIPENRLDAIFDAFEQAETSTARKYGGTGLGLPISRALCELLGYDLAVSSRVGTGTEFTIRLDRARVSRPLEASVRVPSSPPLVLVVDDDLQSRTFLTAQLEQLGYRTVSAFSGTQALNLATALRPQLITIDLMMPDQTGWELAAKLKAEPSLAAIPIVMITLQGEAAAANVIGAIDVLEKPFDPAQLRAVLQRNLHAPSGRVLVVDDDADMRELLQRMLQDGASEVRLASDGQAALEVIRSGFEPDVILLDLVMPVLDGFAVIEVLRHQGRLPRTPIVVITGRDLTPAENDSLRSATAAILTKGIGLEHDVRRALHAYLPLSLE